MTECPHCGGTDGVEWKDYGNVYTYHQDFGNSIERREVVTINNINALPVWCKCMDCGKRIRIKDIEAQDETQKGMENS